MRQALRAFAALAVLATLAGCAVPAGPAARPGASAGFGQPAAGPPPPVSWTVPAGPGVAFTPIAFSQLPGWSADHLSRALPAFLAGCDAMAATPGQSLGGGGLAGALGGRPALWRGVCARARAVPPGDAAAARRFFEAAFQPYGISADGGATGLFTGYYEPEVAGSLTETARYRYPLYRRPNDLPQAASRHYYSRTQIDHGALAHRHLELLWLADPIDVFFLHIQGAGRVRLPDGQVVRVTYDGKNGQPYVPIGRVLVDRGAMTLDQVSMQSIRAWLDAHPGQAQALMEQNPSYVFFREIPGVAADAGAPGSLGAPLTPGRSLAVDRAYVPLGAPVWVDTRDTLDGKPIQRLLFAQDLGGAIRGPVRGDIFFGWGPAADAHAGRMRGQGLEIVLLPRQP